MYITNVKVTKGYITVTTEHEDDNDNTIIEKVQYNDCLNKNLESLSSLLIDNYFGLTEGVMSVLTDDKVKPKGMPHNERVIPLKVLGRLIKRKFDILVNTNTTNDSVFGINRMGEFKAILTEFLIKPYIKNGTYDYRILEDKIRRFDNKSGKIYIQKYDEIAKQNKAIVQKVYDISKIFKGMALGIDAFEDSICYITAKKNFSKPFATVNEFPYKAFRFLNEMDSAVVFRQNIGTLELSQLLHSYDELFDKEVVEKTKLAEKDIPDYQFRNTEDRNMEFRALLQTILAKTDKEKHTEIIKKCNKLIDKSYKISEQLQFI